MISLRNKTIFITGASIGIGREDAFKFAREGCKLALSYFKDEKEAKSVAKKCLDLGSPETLLIHLDIRKDSSITKTVQEIIDRFGRVSILINNAAVIYWKPLEKQSFEEIKNQIKTNLEGLIKITKTLIPYIDNMVINMGSAASMPGNVKTNQSVYSATKWGVRGFTQALAKEYPNLKIYNFVSGGIATRMKNYKGTEPSKIAQLILDFAKQKYTLKSGSDINARNFIDY